MTRILIPRSDSISAKNVSASDWEKYFTSPQFYDYIKSGFAISAGTGLTADVAIGTARVLGLDINNTAIETTATLATNDESFIYILINRDGNSEPESWSLFVNLTGALVTDAYLLGSATTDGVGVTAVNNTLAKNNNLIGFVGTGAEIDALTQTFAGMKAFCILDGNGFTIGNTYRRNENNTIWEFDFAQTETDFVVLSHSTTIGDYTDVAGFESSDGRKREYDHGEHGTSQHEICSNCAGTRSGVEILAGHPLIGKKVFTISVWLRGVGTAASTVNIRNAADVIVATASIAGFTSGGPVRKDVTLDVVRTIVAGDRISVEKTDGGSGSSFVQVFRDNTGVTNIENFLFTGSYTDNASRHSRFIADSFIEVPISVTDINPWISWDLGSQQLLSGISINPEATTTVTEIKVETSVDASTWTLARTITYSDLIEAANNFIRFNIIEGRYIRIFGTDGTSKILAITDLQILTKTLASALSEHGHIVIDPTNTLLGLDGIAV